MRFFIGLSIMNDIYEDKSEWKYLFASQNFFHRYKYGLYYSSYIFLRLVFYIDFHV